MQNETSGERSVASNFSRRILLTVTIVGTCAILLTVQRWWTANSTHQAVSAVQLTPHGHVAPPDARASLLELASIERAVELASDYLVRCCKSDGRFVYRRDPQRPQWIDKSYNVLRHAGTMYALAQRHMWRPDPDVVDTLRRAGGFLQRETIRPLPGRDDLLAVWSPPAVEGRSGPWEVKLGGTGLGLVALLSLESIEPGHTPGADLERLGRFLIYMQKPTGAFYAKYTPRHGGRSDRFVSLYYPGEAALGLAKLARTTGDRSWSQAALSALLHLAESRKGDASVPADHWALLATAELLVDNPAAGITPTDRETLLNHARQIVRQMLAEQQSQAQSPWVAGGFVSGGRTTPTATRLEGLTAAWTVFPVTDTALRSEIMASARNGIGFLLSTQFRTGPYAGGVPHSAGMIQPVDSQTLRDANNRSMEIRIDYVQHAMSAMVAIHVHHDERCGERRALSVRFLLVSASQLLW